MLLNPLNIKFNVTGMLKLLIIDNFYTQQSLSKDVGLLLKELKSLNLISHYSYHYNRRDSSIIIKYLLYNKMKRNIFFLKLKTV